MIGQIPETQPDTKPGLTAIVPAYNECDRIGNVLSILLQVNVIDEVIVVDDGSTDGMSSVVAKISQENPRLKLVRHKVNRGKGQAILTGWRASHSPVLLLLDADLINLTAQHVDALVQPVLSGDAEMTIGLFQHGYIFTDLSHRATPWLSGQRCLRAVLMKRLPVQALQGYGFETCLTILARQEKWRVKNVSWLGVTHPMGILPRGGWSGLRRKGMMFRDIINSWLVIEFGWSWPVRRRYKVNRNR